MPSDCEENCGIEVAYWYNIIPKDNVSAFFASANMIQSFQVQLKGIDTAFLSESEEVSG